MPRRPVWFSTASEATFMMDPEADEAEIKGFPILTSWPSQARVSALLVRPVLRWHC